MQKEKKLGLFLCTFMLIGGMIGSAIFSLSGLTIVSAGPAALISWGLAAVVMLFYGLLMAELSCKYPNSGGVYVFPVNAIGGRVGNVLAWVSAWGSMLCNICCVGFSAIFIGTYLSVCFDWAANLQLPIALLSVIFVVGLNLFNIKTASIIHTIITIILIIALIVYSIVGLSFSSFSIENFQPFFSQGINGDFGYLTMVQTAIVAYSAVIAIAFMVDNVKRPNKTVPASCVIAIIVVFAVYFCVIFATIGVVSVEYLQSNHDLQMIPLFAACWSKLNATPWLQYVICIAAILSLVTTMIICSSLSGVVVRTTSKAGILPRIFCMKNKFGTATLSILVPGFIMCIMACFTEYALKIANFGILFNAFTITVLLVSYIIMRIKEKDNLPSFSLKGGPLIAVALIFILVVCNLYTYFTCDSSVYIFTFIFLLLGLIIYALKNLSK